MLTFHISGIHYHPEINEWIWFEIGIIWAQTVFLAHESDLKLPRIIGPEFWVDKTNLFVFLNVCVQKENRGINLIHTRGNILRKASNKYAADRLIKHLYV